MAFKYHRRLLEFITLTQNTFIGRRLCNECNMNMSTDMNVYS